MCGIVGYIGRKKAYDILVKGLKRLEYRGYDSAGIALRNGKTEVYKCKGKVADLESHASGENLEGDIGIGHTRWATHGEPNDTNAHPHRSMNNKFTLIHNGIIENYDVLKKEMEADGVLFKSDTDTEVLVNLIEYIYMKESMEVEDAITMALEKVVGAYGLLILCEDQPEKLYAIRKGSPLVVGLGDGEYFMGSDATPIIEYTNRVIYLNDDDLLTLTRDSLSLKTIHNDEVSLKVQKLDLKLGDIDKGSYDHFMLKEIFEQPHSIEDTSRGRLMHNENEIKLGGILDQMDKIMAAKRIIIIGCGTSWHAGLIGEYLIEDLARIPVEVEYASEFRYRNPVLTQDDVVIAISQSGETADTLAAIKLAKDAGALVLGICNVVGSSIARETHGGVYTHAGVEIGVASTKAFTCQVTVLYMMALFFARNKKTISDELYSTLYKELKGISTKIEVILQDHDEMKRIASLYKDVTSSLYLGRGILYPVALEGALKLKEISYIHAEGYPAAEMKHGPIALIDEKMPVVFVAAKDDQYEKILSNIQEVKARKGIVIAIVSQGDKAISEIADHVLEIPDCHSAIAPLLTVIPMQLLAYYIAVEKGCNVDQPRNLAKSVTVE